MNEAIFFFANWNFPLKLLPKGFFSIKISLGKKHKNHFQFFLHIHFDLTTPFPNKTFKKKKPNEVPK
jgi:hypothetical protein